MTSNLYSTPVSKQNPPNTLESVLPCSGHYSLKKDLRLNFWLAVAGMVYVIDSELAKRHPEWSVAMRTTTALAPLVPGLLYLRSCMRFVGGLDELQRRVQLEAWLFAAIGTVIVGTAVSTLGSSGIRLGVLEHGLGVGPAFTVILILWLVGSAFANRRFR